MPTLPPITGIKLWGVAVVQPHAASLSPPCLLTTNGAIAPLSSSAVAQLFALTLVTSSLLSSSMAMSVADAPLSSRAIAQLSPSNAVAMGGAVAPLASRAIAQLFAQMMSGADAPLSPSNTVAIGGAVAPLASRAMAQLFAQMMSGCSFT